mmetsp:Transcript_18328/g.50893  ORF Transcript_18328/g.50893 Transcript_18328/m.50893 type:complete len:208 (+) Transcript_18328:132-755(+)
MPHCDRAPDTLLYEKSCKFIRPAEEHKRHPSTMVPESSMRQRVVARQAVDGQAARPMLARGHHGAEAEAIGRNLAPLESALAVVKESQHNGEGMPIEIHAVLVPAQKLSIPVVQDVTEAHLHMLVAEGPQQKICGREDLRADCPVLGPILRLRPRAQRDLVWLPSALPDGLGAGQAQGIGLLAILLRRIWQVHQYTQGLFGSRDALW